MSGPAELFSPGPAEELKLYDWQKEAVEKLRENIRNGATSQILVAPTGSGKTECASFLLKRCHERGQKGIFICDRINLINQASARLDRYGIPHGVIQGDHWRYRPNENIQVASAQTLSRRTWPQGLSLIVPDEAHVIHRDTAERIAQRDCAVVGLTATPFTKSLGKYYDAVVNVRTLDQLVEDGYLAPYIIYSATEPNMEGVRRDRSGEWDEDESATRALPIVGDVVEEYLRLGGEKQFMAFGCNVSHCEELRKQFMAAGIVTALYTYRTPDKERDAALKEFNSPNSFIRGMITVNALARGTDCPSAEVVILARPLRKDLAGLIQMLGRGLRRNPANPEKRTVVLDNGGSCRRMWISMKHFFATGEVELDDGNKAKSKAKQQKKEREPMKCPRCLRLHDPLPMCPGCGLVYPKKRSTVEILPGRLSELSGEIVGTHEDRQSIYSQLLGYAQGKGYKEGWVKHKYHERYGVWPKGLKNEPLPPSPGLKNWILSRMIAFHKSKGKQAA